MGFNPLQTRFDRAASSYDDLAFVQRECAKILVSYLINFPPLQTILDIGCGTGSPTCFVRNLFPHSLYTLNDLSNQMLLKAKEKLNFDFKVIQGDFDVLSFPFYDLIISNLAFQWSVDLQKTALKFQRLSKKLLFSIPLKGTFKEWENLFLQKNLNSPLYPYPTEEDLRSFNLNVLKIQTFLLKFSCGLDFMRYLKGLGVSLSRSNYSISLLKEVGKIGPVEVSYKIGFVMG